MPSRDANNATWYLLRTARDFTPRAAHPPVDPHPPERDATLFYDDARNVLELLPRTPARPSEPLPGFAIDPTGDVYRVDPATGRLLVRRCDGSEVPLVCEPNVFASPMGLALDRRGFLYVADPVARRVVVILPDDGSVRAVLAGPLLDEPVDVAVAPSGRIYVCDRAASDPKGGKIVVYNARFAPVGPFPARNADDLPATPRPIAVMVDADGSVLVADASHPRLLHFDPGGQPLADVQLAAAAKPYEGGPFDPTSPPPATSGPTPLLAFDLLSQALSGRTAGAGPGCGCGPAPSPLPPSGTAVAPSLPGTRPSGTRPRFLGGACGPPFPDNDGGLWLAEAHRAYRLLGLRLGRSFEVSGAFISAMLDSGVPGTTWHKVELNAELPVGTSITIETATADQPSGFDGPGVVWGAPLRDGIPIPALAGLTDQLVQSPPGRYLRLRLTLHSDGRGTPSLRWARILYPRVSYLDLLPRIYRRDPDGEQFLERFLALFEKVFTGVENRYEEFSRWLNYRAAPPDVLDWLASLIDLSFDPTWPIARRRALVGEAMALYRKRGTVQGIARYVAIYTGRTTLIEEAFLRRPSQPSFLGGSGAVLGCTFALRGSSPQETPQAALDRQYAHRFTVYVDLDDSCDADTVLAVVDRIVTVNKPAHTVHTIRPVYPEARLELQSTVGFDLVLGGREPPRTPLGGGPASAPRTGVGLLGVDSVLGERRPGFARPLEPVL